MRVCASCGEENPEHARFCLACGAAVGEAPAAEREERKVVSVLFVDLVGFTASSEQADPEDVRAILRSYHGRVKREIEAFGGTVEKFIGDAVMAIFGAPVAHEDDAERAVRSGLRILEAIEDMREGGLELSVRAAVNTGEALVVLGARPEQGEAMVTGDVVNTASRLQATAPVGSLVAGAATERATRSAIEYEPLPAVTVKGKAAPVEIWRAARARGRFGVDAERSHTTPLVGRGQELVLLEQAYRRALREPSLQLVTVAGEPGIGKSRIVAELAEIVDADPELVFWRQGRCLPYGEGITFWALGEIVKAHAGILESDAATDAETKLDEVLGGLSLEISERGWLRARLGPLVGLSSTAAGAEREEAFAAWTRFFEAIALEGPLVLVFEDLHWADDALMAFLEHLAGWSTDVPLLIVCTARPELYERVPSWGGGKRNSTTIALSPLSAADTGHLVSALLERHALPAEVVEAVMERAGGNPLYAEEFVRALLDRGALRERGRALELDAGALIDLPDTVAALISARLDTLPAGRKALLQDAAVLGKVFWAGALVAMDARDASDVAAELRELSQKELVRRVRTSSVAGESEYTFWHGLVRDVAYGQIPRTARASRHLAAAAWIEDMAGDRITDFSEVLTHHYEHALDNARLGGHEALVVDATAKSRRALTLAADRAFGLDYAKAEDFTRRALALASGDETERGLLLLRLAECTDVSGQTGESDTIALEALRLFDACGDVERSAQALIHRAQAAWNVGAVTRGDALLADAIARLEPLGATATLAHACRLAYFTPLQEGNFEESVRRAAQSVSLALALELPREEATARAGLGFARLMSGDEQGADDCEQALAAPALQANPFHVVVALINYGDALSFARGPEHGLAQFTRAAEVATACGARHAEMRARAEMIPRLFALGRWDDVARLGEPIVAWARERGLTDIEVLCLTWMCAVALLRRELPGHVVTTEFEDASRRMEELEIVIPALGVLGELARSRGDDESARMMITRIADAPGFARMRAEPVAVRIALALDDRALAARLLADAEPRLLAHRLGRRAALASVAEFDGDPGAAAEQFQGAAAGWDEFGNAVERAYASLGHGRCLISAGRESEALGPLTVARDVFARFGARVLLAEVDALLGQAQAASA